MITLYNTLSRSLIEFHPVGGKVRVYSCGPTVYSHPHIGNFRTFIFNDTLVRTLKFLGHDTVHIMNITDVGHLTDNGDADKMERAAVREHKTAWDVAAYYTDIFLKDFVAVGCNTPDHLPRATAFIAEQIAIVEMLESKGYTYRTSDGIYFDTSTFPGYGALSGQTLAEKQGGARVTLSDEKRNITDFALWKFSKPEEKRHMEWPSPWGVGFPGWHIECSAMSRTLLGQPFDIHTGGIDLISPHHDNEIAQSECAFEAPLANIWMHGAFILVDGVKMSKSLANIYTIQDLVEKGFDPLAYRYLVLQSHYQSTLNFTFESLTAAATGLKKLRDMVSNLEDPTTVNPEYSAKFSEALAHNLGTPQALAVMFDLLKSDLPSGEKAATIKTFDTVLGLNLFLTLSIPSEILALGEKRQRAREKKDFAESDVVRAEIAARGYIIKDTPTGFEITQSV